MNSFYHENSTERIDVHSFSQANTLLLLPDPDRISGEHWTMENVQKHFKEKRDDLYSLNR
jgi:hypothetical protein